MSSLGRVTGLRQPVWIEVAGLTYEVVPHDFRLWVAARMEATPFYALLDIAAARRLNARTYDRDDPVDLEHLEDAWHKALEAHSGFSRWWEAERLLILGADAFDVVSGEATWRGFDLLTAPLDRALIFIRTLAIRGCEDEKARRKLEQELTMPPPEEVQAKKADPRPGFSPEEQAAAWSAAARGPGVRS